MSSNTAAASTSDRVTGFGTGTANLNKSPYAHLYAEVLQGLNGPFAKFLKSIHGVSEATKVGHTLGLASYSIVAELEAAEALQMLARGSQEPHFKDAWARALMYRYRPLEDATPRNRADTTVRDVIEMAEDWIAALYDAMLNVENCTNKHTSVELGIFKSDSLDKLAVEAACRSVLTALIHRCVVGFCGVRTSAYASREDKKLSCKDRLEAVISALQYDKRICKDVMTEDSKIAFLVHAPLAVSKLKKNQEKGNDIKRDILATGAAIRRSQRGSSHATLSMSSSPALAPAPFPPMRKQLTPLAMTSSPAFQAAEPAAGAFAFPPSVNLLSSDGFATLNDGKKRKRTVVKAEKEEDDVVFVSTKKVKGR